MSTEKIIKYKAREHEGLQIKNSSGCTLTLSDTHLEYKEVSEVRIKDIDSPMG